MGAMIVPRTCDSSTSRLGSVASFAIALSSNRRPSTHRRLDARLLEFLGEVREDLRRGHLVDRL